MGCGVSRQKDTAGPRRMPGSVGDVVVFLPGLRVPRSVDLSQSLAGRLDKLIVERLSALRARVVDMAMQESVVALKPRRKTAARHGSSTANLLQALEDYLPVLQGLVKEGSELRHKVQFVWANQEDNAEETAMADAWYEVLSVLHLMAMVCLLQANSLLLPRSYGDGYAPRVSEESRRATVDVFLKAAGYLDCAIRQVLPQMPSELRRQLPVDLAEGNLKALILQALGQGVDMQLGLAIDSPNATLAVKRRLACEMVKYWHQVQENIPELPISDGWGRKHLLFIKWKYVEAKAAAYYFHGLILDEGNTEKSHGMAIVALQASEEFLKESRRASEAFHATPPTSRIPTPFGTTKYLLDKIPKDVSSKIRINQDLYTQERVIETPPPLPDFAVALKPDDYDLPPLDPLWNKEDSHDAEAMSFDEDDDEESIDVKVQKALDCPCVADLKSGPCGSQFVDAFSCFLKSTEVEKGSDCVKPFIALQDCIKANPEAFSKEILEEEENDEEAEKSSLRVRAPAWSREPKPKL